jgi:glycosyltransferase involved in cell wall biosynthesis
MRVAIISDSPTLPTGFARTTRSLVHTLASLGHEVSCYGHGMFGETFDPTLYPCRIWPAGENSVESKELCRPFLASEKPEVILINYDLVATLVWLGFLRTAAPGVEVVCQLIVDGLPVYPQFLEPLRRCAAIIAVTQVVQAHLAAALPLPIHYLPHTVDGEKFRPRKDAATVRRALFGEAFVVGTIAQNRSRKQLTQTIHAVRLLRDAGRNVVFLLHTDRVRGLRYAGSPLRKIVDHFGIGDIVHMTESRRRVDAVAEDAHAAASRFGVSLQLDQLGELSVPERLNLCDVAVVASSFGGFEYGIIEAQACGVPVCVTDDRGIMMEVAGGACEPLRPALFEFTEYGAQVWKLAPETIAAAIAKLIDEPARRTTLQAAGIQNAQRYDEARNEEVTTALLGKILGALHGPRGN